MKRPLSINKQMATIFRNRPVYLFEKSEIVKLLNQTNIDNGIAETVKPKTVAKYLERFQKLGNPIVEQVTDPSGNIRFRCTNPALALAYLQGHWQDYRPGMPPTVPPIRPADSVRHRVVYKLQLSNSELELVRGAGTWERFGRSPGYWRVNDIDFSLRVWSSGKARVFLKDDWRKGMQQLFGAELVHQVEFEIANGNGHVGWARHPPVESSNLPVGNLLKVTNPEGKVTTFQYGFSQIKTGELDRHGPENEPYADLTEKWLFDELKFKTDLVNKIASLDRVLGFLSQNQTKTNELLDRLLNGNKLKPDQQPYQAPSEDKGDYSYR